MFRTITAIASRVKLPREKRPAFFSYRGVPLRIVLSTGGVYEVYLPSGFYLVRGQGDADYARARAIAERLVDWLAAGYQLQYHPNSDIGVLIGGVERLIHSPPAILLIPPDKVGPEETPPDKE
jgi:hypothetical protein